MYSSHNVAERDYQNYQHDESDETGESDSGLSQAYCEQILGRPCKSIRIRKKVRRTNKDAAGAVWLAGNKFHDNLPLPLPPPTAPTTTTTSATTMTPSLPPTYRNVSAQAKLSNYESIAVQTEIEQVEESIQVHDLEQRESSQKISPKESPKKMSPHESPQIIPPRESPQTIPPRESPQTIPPQESPQTIPPRESPQTIPPRESPPNKLNQNGGDLPSTSRQKNGDTAQDLHTVHRKSSWSGGSTASKSGSSHSNCCCRKYCGNRHKSEGRPKTAYASIYTQTSDIPTLNVATETETEAGKTVSKKIPKHGCKCRKYYESDTEYVEEIRIPVEKLRWEVCSSDQEDDHSIERSIDHQEDLNYQYQDDYADLLEELEEKLIVRNRERVRKTMYEFEKRSRQNQNLEKPIFDDEEFDEPNPRELLRMSNKKPPPSTPPCLCMCCRAKETKKQQKLRKYPQDDNDDDDDENDVPWRMAKPPPPPIPKFETNKNNHHHHTRWAMNPRNGEWFRIGHQDAGGGDVREQYLFSGNNNNSGGGPSQPLSSSSRRNKNDRCKRGNHIFMPLTLKK